jgi:hypothetical protein
VQPIKQIQNRRNTLATEVTLNRNVLERLKSLTSEVTIGARSPIDMQIKQVAQEIEVLEGKIETIDFCIGVRSHVAIDTATFPELSRTEAVTPDTKVVPKAKARDLNMKFKSNGDLNIQATVRDAIQRLYKRPGTIVPLEDMIEMFHSRGIYASKNGTDIKTVVRVAMNNMAITRIDLTKHQIQRMGGIDFIYRTV